MLTRSILAAVLLQALSSFPVAAEAAYGQEVTPLQKSDIVRLLTGGTYTDVEIAGMIGRSCLSFRPTDRDLQNFRTLGASETVMNAVQTCAARDPVLPAETRAQPAEAVTPTGTPPGAVAPAAGSGEVTLFLSPRRVEVDLGEAVTITAELTYGATAARGIQLELREALDGSPGTLLESAATDQNGVASFRIPPATEAGTRLFMVVSAGRTLQGLSLVEVTAISPEAVEPEPSPQVPASPVEESVDDALGRANELSRQGQFGNATAIYARLAREVPGNVDVLASYGSHLARAGDHEQAEAVLQRARALDPSRVDVRKTLGYLALWRTDVDAAIGWFLGVKDIAPEDADVWRGLGQAYAAAGREREAREALRRADELERSPGTP
jgi:tetratricopeptide (TPR) repeat protein